MSLRTRCKLAAGTITLVAAALVFIGSGPVNESLQGKPTRVGDNANQAGKVPRQPKSKQQNDPTKDKQPEQSKSHLDRFSIAAKPPQSPPEEPEQPNEDKKEKHKPEEQEKEDHPRKLTEEEIAKHAQQLRSWVIHGDLGLKIVTDELTSEQLFQQVAFFKIQRLLGNKKVYLTGALDINTVETKTAPGQLWGNLKHNQWPQELADAIGQIDLGTEGLEILVEIILTDTFSEQIYQALASKTGGKIVKGDKYSVLLREDGEIEVEQLSPRR